MRAYSSTREEMLYLSPIRKGEVINSIALAAPQDSDPSTPRTPGRAEQDMLALLVIRPSLFQFSTRLVSHTQISQK